MGFPQQRGTRIGRSAVRRLPLRAAIGAGLVSILTACTGTGQANPTVRVVPAPAAGTWSWSASCPFTPDRGTTCRAANPAIGNAQLSGDEWNLGDPQGKRGTVGMTADASRGVTVRADLPDAPPCTATDCTAPSANTWVRGYPSVLYGINQCNASTSPATSPELALPMRVDEIPPDLIGTTTYSLHPTDVTYDVAYDLWLNHSSTRAPCRTTGTLEVMVWTGYDDRALLPPSLLVGTVSSPFEIDGISSSGDHAWSVYASNLYGDGRTAPWGGTLWFVLDKREAVDHGTVRVDLSSVLAAAGGLLQRDYGWRDFGRSYWLDTIPFGMEFGPASGTLTGRGSSHFSLALSSFCLDTGTTVSTARC
jgi:hypothetical protein